MSNAPEPTYSARARRRRVRCLAGSVALAATLVVVDGVAVEAGTPARVLALSPTADSVIGLHYGSYGDSVRELQRALIRVGVGVVGGVDGYFGSATRASVRAFQNYKGLTVTGVVDAATARALGLTAPAPSAPSAPSSGPLARGATGERVRQLQRSLVNAGIHVPGGVDGIFGPGTESAIAAYQRSRGLVPTGRADTATLSALSRGAPAVGASGLAQGARGDAVRTLQQALANAGIHVPGGVDGIFGPGTESAVRAYQRSRGLSVTGRADATTLNALARHAPAVSSPSRPSRPDRPHRGGGGLARGATGDAVRELQAALMRAGITVPGGADGVFGPATEAALRTYQRRVGLPATGRADAATLNRLILHNGSRGEAVKQLQRALMRAGITVPGGADGVFGSATEAALKTYQRREGLPQTGRLDRATAAALAQERGHRPPRGGGGGPSRPHRPNRPHRGGGGLAQGATGSAVRELQAALMRAGITVPGGADGVFGPATEAALKTYQRRVGLPATGRADAATMNRLILHNGSRGEAVKQLQRALMRAGITVPGGADGVFGSATEAALKTYQRREGLPQTGRLDRATAAALAQERGHRPPRGGGRPGGGGTAPGFPRFDERGSRVVALQQALVRAHIPLCGGVDGVFGSCTTNALTQFQRSRGLSPTGRVDQATANALGLRPAPAPSSPPPVSVSLQHVPVRPPCWYADTWHAPRGGGRVHLGVDIIAGRGAPEYAVANGVITLIYRDTPGSLSGNGLKLTRSDGTYFFYAHLSRFARGISVGSYVSAGQVIGYVGSTGNSATPHLHFEVHPGGGSAVNPTPIVRAAGTC